LGWIVVRVAHRAVKVPGPLLRGFYLRLEAMKGVKLGIVTVARKLLVLIWTLLTRKDEYREPSRPYEAKVHKMERLARAYPVATSTAGGRSRPRPSPGPWCARGCWHRTGRLRRVTNCSGGPPGARASGGPGRGRVSGGGRCILHG